MIRIFLTTIAIALAAIATPAKADTAMFGASRSKPVSNPHKPKNADSASRAAT